MKRILYIMTIFVVFMANDLFSQHHGGGGMLNHGREKDPGMAALLSIQPLPIAFGNFYTGNWSRGVMYTTAELALFIPGTILLGRNMGWGMHSYSNYSDNERSWTRGERNQFYYLLAGYVVVKIISALDAGYSAEKYNQNLSIKHDAQTNTTMLTINIPVH